MKELHKHEVKRRMKRWGKYAQESLDHGRSMNIIGGKDKRE